MTTPADLTRATAAQLAEAMAAGEVSSVEITQAHLDRIAAVDGDVHAFLHVDGDRALARAAEIDAGRAAGRVASPLAGVPLALKDVVVQSGAPTTAASKMLEGWIPPFDATVTKHLNAAGIVILGKTNLDEFAMGSSTENSAYGPTHNPWDLTRIPGGSGGGSAAAIAAFEAPLAIGTDTGGSIRQPAAVTGTIGVKPTYGGVSRHGVISLASSLDQVGPCARTVLDAALLHEAIAGHDPYDATSIPQPVPSIVAAARRGRADGITGVKIGVVTQLGGDGYQPGVMDSFRAAVKQLADLGAEIIEVDCPNFEYAMGAYYLIQSGECSSNLARFDAMRYGFRAKDDGAHSAEQVMAASRGAGFGPEVKRRILLGTYALQAGFYDRFFEAGQKARTLVNGDLSAAFGRVDVLVSPTTPVTAFPIGEKVDDAMSMYLNDLATVPASLAGVPAMSMPSGLAADTNLPVGLQIIAPHLGEEIMYQVAAAYERARDDADGGPLLGRIGELTAAGR